MFLIGQSKLFVRFLSRKTTWSTSSMNMKVIDADTDPGEPLTQEEVDWMFRSEEQDGGEYTSMTERGRDPNEVIKVSMLEHRRAWWRRGERRRHCAIAGDCWRRLPDPNVPLRRANACHTHAPWLSSSSPLGAMQTGLETNDLVEVIADGPFKGFEGHVVEILDDERLIISLSVFGKDTPMEMAKAHVKQLAVGQ